MLGLALQVKCVGSQGWESVSQPTPHWNRKWVQNCRRYTDQGEIGVCSQKFQKISMSKAPDVRTCDGIAQRLASEYQEKTIVQGSQIRDANK
jgi:hypothetical protein